MARKKTKKKIEIVGNWKIFGKLYRNGEIIEVTKDELESFKKYNLTYIERG